MSEDNFTRLSKPGKGLYKEKGSKFYGFAFPVEDAEAFNAYLSEIKKQHPKARHYCFAYRLSPETDVYRASDDGEPKHSAGTPILRQIQSEALHHSAVVVVRYFGGTKLGVSGLIHAYKEAARSAITNAKKTNFFLSHAYRWTLQYTNYDQALRLIDDFQIQLHNQEMTEEVVLHLKVRKSLCTTFEKQVKKLQLGEVIRA
ncbi:MAG: YigZ family protein [Cryomorphaceae bacterium]|nr:YigZ family protein [Cryomorphaceae bacterium]